MVRPDTVACSHSTLHLRLMNPDKSAPLSMGEVALGWVTTLLASPLAGSLSAAFSSAVLQPFDVIRTKQQLSSTMTRPYGGFWSCVARIRSEEGLAGYWRGIGPTMWRVVPGGAVYFFLLDRTSTTMKQTLAPDAKRLPVHLALLSAALARSIASITFLPITVVKTRFEALGASTPYTSTWGALRSIAATEGFRSLWSGLVPTVLRDVPHSALYYAMYNYTKSVLLPMRNPDSSIPIGFLNFTAGIISGLSATIFSHPFDVVRTRLQAQASLSSLGMVNMTLKILKEEGMKTFTKGLTPRLMRRSLSPAFTWTFYEELLALIRR